MISPVSTVSTRCHLRRQVKVTWLCHPQKQLAHERWLYLYRRVNGEQWKKVQRSYHCVVSLNVDAAIQACQSSLAASSSVGFKQVCSVQVYVLYMFCFALGLGCLGGAVFRRRTRDRKVTGLTPGQGPSSQLG